uniref:TonB-dependent receptor n=1 Tax=Steinernema glaseri TaxID=37863 RepID=A0A1I7XWV9_9BILA
MDRIPLQAAEKDPFGLPNFFVQYSLNKRRRWEIPRKLDDIEALQDPSVALRVSTFEFSLDPILEWYAPFIAGNAWFSPRDHLSYNVVRMNTVYPDGEVSHREANLNARGSDLYL